MEAAKRRQGALRRHLTGKSEEDVVVVTALRTPITKARKGGLKDTPADDLVAAVLKGVLDKTGEDSEPCFTWGSPRRPPPAFLSPSPPAARPRATFLPSDFSRLVPPFRQEWPLKTLATS